MAAYLNTNNVIENNINIENNVNIKKKQFKY